jgi:hypothetical protein
MSTQRQAWDAVSPLVTAYSVLDRLSPSGNKEYTRGLRSSLCASSDEEKDRDVTR